MHVKKEYGVHDNNPFLLLKRTVKKVPNYPAQGIVFLDITPVLQDDALFHIVCERFVRRYSEFRIDKIAAVESRGFIFGAAIAQMLNVGFVPLRKAGKLPRSVLQEHYTLEYGSAALEMHADAVSEGESVLVHDDLLATGGTAAAACALIERAGGAVVEASFFIELMPLNGREKLDGHPVFSLLKYTKEELALSC